MQTLELGVVNAGFVFFLLAIVSTLIFGRFFCGWGCHVVALQDLCGALLRRAGIRPKPFRSRLLMWVPLLAAIYMFVLPSVMRLLEGRPMPAWTTHFLTSDFWGTFPSPWVSVLTFAVCGFLIVYLLGNKGFCTYGCPYGGFFGVADRVAPGKIRVTDACDGCGHCTATCTSNVRVHAEVRDHGMVVNPGCMKCMDCVSVCPKEALYFGFGRPSILAKSSRVSPVPPRYDYNGYEETGLAITFLLSVYALRGLYELVPFLLALGAAAICAYLLVQGLRLSYVRDLRAAGMQLRRAGRPTIAGIGFGLGAVLLAAFLLHSAGVQYQTREGLRQLSTSANAENLREAATRLDWAEKWGLLSSPRVSAARAEIRARLGQSEK